MHPYIGLRGRHMLVGTNPYVADSLGIVAFVGGISAADGVTSTTVVLLTDAGGHVELCMELLVLDDPDEARRRLTESR